MQSFSFVKKRKIAETVSRRIRRAVNRQITFHYRDVITDSGVALITSTADRWVHEDVTGKGKREEDARGRGRRE